MEYHEIANIFPMMTDADLEQLKDDIVINGQLDPVTLYEGKILDGRNRWKVCTELGLVINYDQYQGDNPLSFVISKNLHRRHLNPSQRAMIATDVKPLMEVEARKRQATHQAGNTYQLSAKVHEADKGRSDSKAGDLFGVSGRYVAEAEKIKEEAPELVEQILNGELSITQAKRKVVKQRTADKVDLPESKYRVVYADPPWQYGNTMPDDFVEQRDHYRTMSMVELCELPIKTIVEDDAVLFLWVTSPILEDCFQLIKAWGFKYKASFVWDKVKHVMGHYNSVRHEFLLVCVRGSCQPDVKKLFDSVVSIERTEHSAKPGYFRELIDTIYPHGKRIELFARMRAEGWDVYGNEL